MQAAPRRCRSQPSLMDELLDRAPCGFLTFADDGAIRAVNRTLLELLGYERGELEGKHLQQILTPGGRVFHQTHFFPLLKLHGAVEEIYLSLRDKGNGEIPVLVNARRRECTATNEMLNDCILVRMRQRADYESELLKAK